MLTTLTLAAVLTGTLILDDGPHEHSVLTRATRMHTSLLVDFPHLQRATITVHAEQANVEGRINVTREPYTIQWDPIAVEYQGAGLSQSVSFPIWTGGSAWFDATATMTLRNNPTVDVAAYAANLIPFSPGSEGMYPEGDIHPTVSGSPVLIDWTLTGPVSTLTGSYSYAFEANPGNPFGWSFTAPTDEVPDSWWAQWQTYYGERSLPILFEGTLDGVPIRLTGTGPSFSLWWTPEPSTAMLGLLAGLALLKPISARRRRSRPRL